MGYTGDILLIHGTKDKIVNLDYAKRANEMYKANGANIRFEIIEGGGHMFSRKYDVIAIQMLMRGQACCGGPYKNEKTAAISILYGDENCSGFYSITDLAILSGISSFLMQHIACQKPFESA